MLPEKFISEPTRHYKGNPVALIAPVDVRLLKQDEANDLVDTIVQLDVPVVCDANKLDKSGVRGAAAYGLLSI